MGLYKRCGCESVPFFISLSYLFSFYGKTKIFYNAIRLHRRSLGAPGGLYIDEHPHYRRHRPIYCHVGGHRFYSDLQKSKKINIYVTKHKKMSWNPFI